MKKLLPVFMAMMLLTAATCATASAKDVYVTQKGKKYHVEECRWIKNRETIKMEEKEAIKKGYKPCKCVDKDNKENKKDEEGK